MLISLVVDDDPKAMKLRGNIPNYIVKWKLSCNVPRRRRRIPTQSMTPWFTSRIASTTPSILRFIISLSKCSLFSTHMPCHISIFTYSTTRQIPASSHFSRSISLLLCQNLLTLCAEREKKKSRIGFSYFSCLHHINLHFTALIACNQSPISPQAASHKLTQTLCIFTRVVSLSWSAYWNWLTYLEPSTNLLWFSFTDRPTLFLSLLCNLRSTKLRKSSQRWLTRWRAFKCAEKVNMKGWRRK